MIIKYYHIHQKNKNKNELMDGEREKPFKCKHCDKSFKSKGSLTNMELFILDHTNLNVNTVIKDMFENGDGKNINNNVEKMI